MFESILEFANQSASISQVLPPLIRWSVSLVIAFAFSIPLMLIAWLLMWAATPMIEALIARSRGWQTATSEAASHCSNKAADAFKALTANQAFIPLDVPLEFTKPIELGSLENATRQLSDLLKKSPSLEDRDPVDKEKAAYELQKAIDNLNSSQDLVRTPQIPKVSQEDAISKFKKKEAFTALLIFMPLSVIAVTANTALLDIFFSELFPPKEVFGISYSILMSLALSIIEVGAGTILGYIAATEEPKDHGAAPLICWTVISGLVLIESVLYFQVGLTIADIDMEDAMLMIADGEIFSLIVQGTWFTLIGPVIVLSLYLLGHKVSESYFKYSRYAVLDDFRKSLETAYDLSQKYLQDIELGDQQIEDIKLKLKKLDFNRQDREDKLPEQMAKYSAELKEKLKLCEETSETLKASQIQPPSHKAIPVSSEQGANLVKSGIVYLVVLALSILIGMWALPMEQISVIPTNIAAKLVLSLFICSLCIIGGHSLSTRISVVNQDSDGGIAFLVTKRTSQTIVIATIALLLTSAFYILVFKDAETAYPRALLLILSNVACIFVGTRLTSYLPVWMAVVRASLWTLSAGCARVSEALIFLGALICESIQALLRLMAKPAQTLVLRSRIDVDQ